MKIKNKYIKVLLTPLMILNCLIQYILWIIKSLLLIVFIPIIPLFFLRDIKLYDYFYFLISIPIIILLIPIFPISFINKYFKTGEFNFVDSLDIVENCPF
jgi:energy-coupling factor transporter transmembrane protein EcfT